MELGCNTYSLRACPRAEAFAHIRSLGFERVELWSGHTRGGDAAGIAAEARAAGLGLRGYCIGGLFGLAPGDVERRLDQAFRFAAGLGVDLVVGIVDREALPTVDRLCAAHGMRFAVENHWYTEFARPADYAALASCSPAVGINIDTAHFAFLGCDLAWVADGLAERTMNVHVKLVRAPGPLGRLRRRLRRDYAMEPRLPGSGDGLDGFVAALRRRGYGGMLSIEHERQGVPLGELAGLYARAAELVAAGSEAQKP